MVVSVTPDEVNLLVRPTDGEKYLFVELRWSAVEREMYAIKVKDTKSWLLFSGFLCPLSANSFGIDFLSFTISDYETKKTIFEVGRDNPTPQDVSVDFSSIGEDMYRKIKYDFSEDVLRLPYIQTS